MLKDKLIKRVDNKQYEEFTEVCRQKGWRVLNLTKDILEVGMRQIVTGEKTKTDFEQNNNGQTKEGDYND